MLYSSHDFIPVVFDTLLRILKGELLSFANGVKEEHVQRPRRHEVKLQSHLYLCNSDYQFRPRELERFPRYFFISACEARKNEGGSTLDWVVDRGERQYTAKPVLHSELQVPLQTADNQIIYEYAYYVTLRTQKAWKVPVLHGHSPPLPDNSATPAEKGLYALFLNLLFRPHRTFQDILDFTFKGHYFSGSIDEAWLAVYEEFQEWRAKTETLHLGPMQALDQN